MRAPLAILPALLLAACATKTEPVGPMAVIIRHPFNTLTGGVIEAPVRPDGSFENGVRQGNSGVHLSGRLQTEQHGEYEVTFRYQCAIATAPSAIDTKSIQATLITRANDALPVGGTTVGRDGNRYSGAADDISLELKILPAAEGE